MELLEIKASSSRTTINCMRENHLLKDFGSLKKRVKETTNDFVKHINIYMKWNFKMFILLTHRL